MGYRSENAEGCSATEIRQSLQDGYAHLGKDYFDQSTLPAVYASIRDAIHAAASPVKTSNAALTTNVLDPHLKHHPLSRAIYGVDIILDDHLKPYLIEISFCPDFKYASKLYPDMVATLWELLFFGQALKTPPRSPKWQPSSTLCSAQKRIFSTHDDIRTFCSPPSIPPGAYIPMSALSPAGNIHFDLGNHPPAETLRLLARFLLRLCAESEPSGALIDRADPTRHNTAFHARAAPAIDLEAYLARILKYCPCANEVFIALAVYARRLEKVLPVDRFNVHRICISGVVVASKYFSDVFYTNTRYAKVGGLPVSELNALEIKFMDMLAYHVHVTLEELQEMGDVLLQGYRPRPSSVAAPPPMFSAPPTPTVPLDISQMAWRPQTETPIAGTMPLYGQEAYKNGAGSGSVASMLQYNRQYGPQPPSRPLSAGAHQTGFGGGGQRRDTLGYMPSHRDKALPPAPSNAGFLTRTNSSGRGGNGSPSGRHQRAMSYQNGPSSTAMGGSGGGGGVSPGNQGGMLSRPDYSKYGHVSPNHPAWNPGMSNNTMYYPQVTMMQQVPTPMPYQPPPRWSTDATDRNGATSGRTPPRAMGPQHQHRASLPHVQVQPPPRTSYSHQFQPQTTPVPYMIGNMNAGYHQDSKYGPSPPSTAGGKSSSPRRNEVLKEEPVIEERVVDA